MRGEEDERQEAEKEEGDDEQENKEMMSRKTRRGNLNLHKWPQLTNSITVN